RHRRPRRRHARQARRHGMARARERAWRDDEEARLARAARSDPHARRVVGVQADRRSHGRGAAMSASERSAGEGRPAGKRLFVGIRVSVQTANALAAAAETLQRRARDAGLDLKWVAPVNYHVTLKFLGWTRVDA